MISRNSFRLAGVLLILMIGATQLAFGQAETAQISGTVTDQNNAPVAGATVTIKSTQTGFTRTTTTNDEGFYVISNVQPSNYEITVASGSFKEFKAVRDVSVASNITLDTSLSTEVGAVVDIVATGTDVGEINTTDQAVSEVINDRQLQNLPTITRNPYAFVTTLANVSEGDNGGRGVGVAINGQRSASTSVLLNGGENVDAFTATVGQSVPLDSVDEYRVTTGTFTADVGRATGGVVNLITKSGQNRFFGTAYIFNRNSDLSSAGFDANANGTPREFFNRNQFGFSVGGPIIKNKLLFFTNTEWTRIRSTASNLAFVPSAGSIAASAPATRAFFVGQTFAGTPTGITARVAAAATAANPAGSCVTGIRCFVFDQIRYSVPADTGAGTPINGVQSANRIDWNVSNKVSVYGVYSLDKSTAPDGANASSPYAGFNTGFTTDNTNINVASTYALTSNFVGVSRFTYNHLDQDQPLGSQPSQPTLYLRTSVISLAGSDGGLSRVALPGYLPFSPGSAIPFGGPQTVYNFSQEFNFNAGNHLFKFGGQYYKIKDDRAFGAFQNAVETLGNSTGGAIANLFDGVIQTFQAAINPQGRFPGQTITLPVSFPEFGRQNSYDEFAVYGMDSFKLFPGFTANVGLRYEFYGPQRNEDRKLDSNFYFGGDGTFTAANVRTGNVLLAPDSPVGDLWAADKNNFAPSVGFAYDIEGNGNSSLRAGYALRYERNFGNVTFNVIQNPPNYGVVSVTAADFGGVPIPITRNNAGPFAGNVGTVTLLPVSLRAVDPNIKNAFAHQYSAGYERRFLGLTASATFSGTTGKKLYSIANINRSGSSQAYLGTPSTRCPTLATSSRLNCQYGAINFRGNGGYSSYQGITFAVESGNLARLGLTLASRYTYSVSKDNLSTTFSETGNAFNLGFLDAYNPSLDYGFADFDVRHRWINSFVLDLPTNRIFDEGIGRTILGDFILGGIVNIQSGSPFSVYDCNNGITTCTRLVPNAATGRSSMGADVGVNSFAYNALTGNFGFGLPSSAQNPFPGENGFLPENMTARNSFRGPGFWNVDLSLSKKISFTERMNLQFRVDAQNVFNHANLFANVGSADISGFEAPGTPGGNIASPTNPVVTASKFGRRQIQLGVRFSF